MLEGIAGWWNRDSIAIKGAALASFVMALLGMGALALVGWTLLLGWWLLGGKVGR